MTHDEAINKIVNNMVNYKPWEVEALYIAIKALEQTRWIPVNEELPEKSGEYWCTFRGTNLTRSDYYTTEADAKKLFDDPEEYIGWRSQNVIAWMPLPEPYRESEDKE